MVDKIPHAVVYVIVVGVIYVIATVGNVPVTLLLALVDHGMGYGMGWV